MQHDNKDENTQKKQKLHANQIRINDYTIISKHYETKKHINEQFLTKTIFVHCVLVHTSCIFSL